MDGVQLYTDEEQLQRLIGEHSYIKSVHKLYNYPSHSDWSSGSVASTTALTPTVENSTSVLTATSRACASNGTTDNSKINLSGFRH